MEISNFECLSISGYFFHDLSFSVFLATGQDFCEVIPNYCIPQIRPNQHLLIQSQQ